MKKKADRRTRSMLVLTVVDTTWGVDGENDGPLSCANLTWEAQSMERMA